MEEKMPTHRFKKNYPLLLVIYFQIGQAGSFLDPNNMLTFVKELLIAEPVILEVGGRFGEDTIRMKSFWPNATMHVFEPLHSSYEQIIKNTAHLSAIFAYPFALTTYSGKACFYINIHNAGASSIGYPVVWNEHEFDKKPIEVDCTTIDEWAKKNKISRIDFMWLDMEGHELYALQHGKEILNTVQAIYTEISFEPIRENSCSYIDLRNFLVEQGFYEAWKSSETGRFGDALFIRKD